ncbi:thiopurine S-methyltransferase [Neptuniibacter sp.]|uniref:thiopurine S-methyltransferase n=1 Tax=Neptuniibacter sp. TaxID=1962643 RepID=UPI0026107C8F|nr:thiopurine S-methyltransferase [Neptuniibacter sp.]MCP4596414.1 thiopurine S-methyltransferase [Neptuniibacter sp.]
MEHDFWHQRWAEGRIGFHQEDVNPFLKKHWAELKVASDETVFVPLCGKSRDMLWLREQGHPVVGVELSDAACEAFFAENDVEPERKSFGGYVAREVDGIRVLCGDFFALNSELIRESRAVFDRAALVALPPGMRRDYAVYLQQLLPTGSKVLLVTLEFEGESGPPFSVSSEEVEQLYGERFSIRCLERFECEDPRDAGRSEVVWLLEDKAAE